MLLLRIDQLPTSILCGGGVFVKHIQGPAFASPVVIAVINIRLRPRGNRYTMGSAFSDGRESSGVIPSVVGTIYSTIAADPATTFTIRVGFVEIHQVASSTQI